MFTIAFIIVIAARSLLSPFLPSRIGYPSRRSALGILNILVVVAIVPLLRLRHKKRVDSIIDSIIEHHRGRSRHNVLQTRQETSPTNDGRRSRPPPVEDERWRLGSQ